MESAQILVSKHWNEKLDTWWFTVEVCNPDQEPYLVRTERGDGLCAWEMTNLVRAIALDIPWGGSSEDYCGCDEGNPCKI